MPFETPLTWIPNLADAIDRKPLTVSADTSLAAAIAALNQSHHHTCWLTESETLATPDIHVARASCVLVVQDRTLLGIVTERDVVRLTAESIDWQAATVADVMVHPVITLPEQATQEIFAALFLFRRYRIRHLPIVDEQAQLVGIISHESIRQVLRPANLLRFRRVSDVMTRTVINAPLTTTVLALAQLMATQRVSCVVITQQDTNEIIQPVGIVTERDIVQFQALQIALGQTKAQQVMSTPLFLLNPEDSLWTAHQEMQKRRVGRLVVSWNWGQGLGIVTQTSLLRVFDPMEMYGVIENLQQTIQQLEAQQTESGHLSPPVQANLRHSSTIGATPATAEKPLSGQQDAPLPQPSAEDLAVSLHHAQTTVQQIINHPDLSIHHQAQLKQVLQTLEQVSGEKKRFLRLVH
ncbi:MAG: CBS domain-containing protein [Cyanobacteria bacterium P01_G01_bin.54]